MIHGLCLMSLMSGQTESFVSVSGNVRAFAVLEETSEGSAFLSRPCRVQLRADIMPYWKRIEELSLTRRSLLGPWAWIVEQLPPWTLLG